MADFRFGKTPGNNDNAPGEQDGKPREKPPEKKRRERPGDWKDPSMPKAPPANGGSARREREEFSRRGFGKPEPSNGEKRKPHGKDEILRGKTTVWNEEIFPDRGRRQELDAFGRVLRLVPEKPQRQEKKMFYTIKGTVTHMEPGFAVLDCGGVGFKCFTSLHTQRSLRLGEPGMLFTHLNVREDALDLFGFAMQSELNCFKLLTAVSGVGPKAALAILSELTPEQVAMAAASGDSKALTRASGVGPKLAQRIVLELRDKVKKMTGTPLPDFSAAGAASASSNAGNAVSALTVLGYAPSDAAAVVAKFDSALPTEELIRLSLREMGRNR